MNDGNNDLGQSIDQSPAAQSAGQGDAGIQGGQAPQAAPQKLEISEESLAKMAQVLQSQARAAEPPKELDPAEFEQKFNVFRPTAKHWQALRGDDENAAVAALTEMLQGASKQAVTLALFGANQQISQLQEQFKPALSFAEQKSMENLKNEFFETYQDLKGLEPLLLTIRDSLIKEGAQFKTKDEAFKAVADKAYTLMETVPGFKRGVETGGKAQSKQSTSRMPALSGAGGQGGTGDGRTAPATGVEADLKNIFGRRGR